VTLNAEKETQNWDTCRTANADLHVPVFWGGDKQRGEESRGKSLLVSEKEGGNWGRRRETLSLKVWSEWTSLG